MEKKFDAVIFDLGGVLYDIDLHRSVDAFARLGLKDFDELYSLKEQTELFNQLEKGRIGKEEFVKRVNSYSPVTLDAGQVCSAWNKLLIGISAETIGLLKELSKMYRLFLLSNTNLIHLSYINEEMQEKFGIPELDSLFEKAWFSCQIGMRKPDREIYEFALKDARLDASRTVFFDDNKDNVEGAKAVGIHSVLKPREEPLLPFLQAFLE